MIIQDPWTSFYETNILKDTISLFAKLGIKVGLHPFFETGKALHILGYQKEFTKRVVQNQPIFEEYHQKGITMMCIEPSIVGCLNHDYQQVINKNWKVIDCETVLYNHLQKNKKTIESVKLKSTKKRIFFDHCIKKSKNESKNWGAVYQQLGLNIKTAQTSCCGMAGLYGMHKKNQNESKALFNKGWYPYCDGQKIIVNGYSCRSQFRLRSNLAVSSPISDILDLFI